MGVFCDVADDSVYRPFIEALWDAKITAGCSGTTPCNQPSGDLNFCPTNNITTYEAAIFIIRALSAGNPKIVTTTIPPDVLQPYMWSDTEPAETTSPQAWMQSAAKYGIFCGPERTAGVPDYGPCLGLPTTAIKRKHMASFIVRALGDMDDPSGQHFADVTTAHPYYREIGRLFERGITAGCSAPVPPTLGNFCPDDNIKRQEMAIFICRAFNIPTEGGPPIQE